jgi:hypothetical protein
LEVVDLRQDGKFPNVPELPHEGVYPIYVVDSGTSIGDRVRILVSTLLDV